MRITEENIWDEIRKKNYLKVLNSDLVDKVKDKYGETPLHWLAWKEVKEIIHHPSVDKVKDNNGATPLHCLAQYGVKDILHHPSVDKVKNTYGWTPLHGLAYWGQLTKEDLKERFPWYKKEIKDLEDAVEEIVDTPDSIKFILED